MTFTDDQNQYISELLELSERSVNKAIDLFEDRFHFRPVKESITKRWKLLGYSQNHGGHRFGLDKKGFMELYRKHNGDITAMMGDTRDKAGTLIGLCEKYGLEYQNAPEGVFKKKSKQGNLEYYSLLDRI